MKYTVYRVERKRKKSHLMETKNICVCFVWYFVIKLVLSDLSIVLRCAKVSRTDVDKKEWNLVGTINHGDVPVEINGNFVIFVG